MFSSDLCSYGWNRSNRFPLGFIMDHINRPTESWLKWPYSQSPRQRFFEDQRESQGHPVFFNFFQQEPLVVEWFSQVQGSWRSQVRRKKWLVLRNVLVGCFKANDFWLSWDLLQAKKKSQCVRCYMFGVSFFSSLCVFCFFHHPWRIQIPLKMDGWHTTFLLGNPIFRCKPLVSGRVIFYNFQQLINGWSHFVSGWDRRRQPGTSARCSFKRVAKAGSRWSVGWFVGKGSFGGSCNLAQFIGCWLGFFKYNACFSNDASSP